jgi:DNA mismatch repair protein MutS
LVDDLPLFSAAASAPAKPAAPAASPVVERLSQIQPDDLTAREALDLLYELKSLLQA